MIVDIIIIIIIQCYALFKLIVTLQIHYVSLYPISPMSVTMEYYINGRETPETGVINTNVH